MGVVVVAIDLTQDSYKIIDRAISMLKKDQYLVLVHVIEYDLSIGSYMHLKDPEIKNQAINEKMQVFLTYVKKRVEKAVSELVVSSNVSTGIVIDICDSYDIDLLVCGKKKKTDIFNQSKSFYIVKNINCDTLIVKL